MEIWKDIPGYEGKYQASTQGRIRSLTRPITQMSRYGHPFTRIVKGRILRPAASKNAPHLYVVLGHGAAGSPVHQLIAAAFHGPHPTDVDVRHLDGNIQNNAADNLCYGTRTDNILDVYRIGRAWRKLTLDQIKEIERRMHNGSIGAQVAREYDVSESTVSCIKLGRYKSCTL